MRIALSAALLCCVLAGCSGLDLRNNPGREVDKQTGPLVTPPEHLKNGAVE